MALCEDWVRVMRERRSVRGGGSERTAFCKGWVGVVRERRSARVGVGRRKNGAL